MSSRYSRGLPPLSKAKRAGRKRADQPHPPNMDYHGNVTATEGCSRCDCGCKYWENDRCVDCGTQHHPRHDQET